EWCDVKDLPRDEKQMTVEMPRDLRLKNVGVVVLHDAVSFRSWTHLLKEEETKPAPEAQVCFDIGRAKRGQGGFEIDGRLTSRYKRFRLDRESNWTLSIS